MTKFQLAAALFTDRTTFTTIRYDNQTTEGIICSVERESGDGQSFIVTYYDRNNRKQTRCVRTID